jgi:hypothetical protein
VQGGDDFSVGRRLGHGYVSTPFNRDPKDIPESRRQPTLPGMSGGERASRSPPPAHALPCAHRRKSQSFMCPLPGFVECRPGPIGPHRLLRRCPPGRS